MRTLCAVALVALCLTWATSPAHAVTGALCIKNTLNGSLKMRSTGACKASEIQIGSFDGTTLQLTGINVQIVSGSGSTDAPVNGKGNLIVGYNANTGGHARTGSHNLIVGDEHTYSSHGGLVVGFMNSILAPGASVSGGGGNTASADLASVSGGVSNNASAFFASVSGGQCNLAGPGATPSCNSVSTASSVSGGLNNVANGSESSVSGGMMNLASGPAAAVSGGMINLASGTAAAVSGGECNVAGNGPGPHQGCAAANSGPFAASVSGGAGNVASGTAASVSGGSDNMASGNAASVSGGIVNSATGFDASVSGGVANVAGTDPSMPLVQGPVGSAVSGGACNVAGAGTPPDCSGIAFLAPSVSGGTQNVASGQRASVSGGQGNDAYAPNSSVSGGQGNVADGTNSSVSGGVSLGGTHLGTGEWHAGRTAGFPTGTEY